MMEKIIRILAIAAIGSVLAMPAAAVEKKLSYRSFTQEAEPHEVVDETDVRFAETPDGGATILRSKQSDKCLIHDEFTLDKDYSLIRWSRSCPEEDTNFVAERKGESLLITGKFYGKPLEKELELGNKYLHIYPNYSLGKFAFSGAKNMKFWSMRRDELDLLPMQAKVLGEEKIVMDGKEVEAVKVYYSIVGKMREKYFNHTYYYRKSDGVYLKKIQQDGEVEVLVKEK